MWCILVMKPSLCKFLHTVISCCEQCTLQFVGNCLRGHAVAFNDLIKLMCIFFICLVPCNLTRDLPEPFNDSSPRSITSPLVIGSKVAKLVWIFLWRLENVNWYQALSTRVGNRGQHMLVIIIPKYMIIICATFVSVKWSAVTEFLIFDVNHALQLMKVAITELQCLFDSPYLGRGCKWVDGDGSSLGAMACLKLQIQRLHFKIWPMDEEKLMPLYTDIDVLMQATMRMCQWVIYHSNVSGFNPSQYLPFLFHHNSILVSFILKITRKSWALQERSSIQTFPN